MSKKIHSTELYSKIISLLAEARNSVIRTVNHTMVVTYYEIGKMIIEEEQHGEDRVEYGKGIIKELSVKLIKEFGKGSPLETLSKCVSFISFIQNRRQCLRYLLKENSRHCLRNSI